MWRNPQETADLVTFTEEILNEKLHFLWSVIYLNCDLLKLEIRDSYKKPYCDYVSIPYDYVVPKIISKYWK